jgi:Site-specific recombinase XerD
VQRIAREAGITSKVSPHTLRHTYASLAEEGGVTMRQVQQALNHADVSTTEIYVHSRPAGEGYFPARGVDAGATSLRSPRIPSFPDRDHVRWARRSSKLGHDHGSLCDRFEIRILLKSA